MKAVQNSGGTMPGEGLPNSNELQRMMLQLFFTIVIALLLINMVAGIIIETFNQIFVRVASDDGRNSLVR